MPICQIGGAWYPLTRTIDRKHHILNNRIYCLDCSPPGIHTSMREITPLPPSPDLAYLLGIISGDGCLYQYARTCELFITCDDRYPDLIEKYAALLDGIIEGNVRIHHSNQGNFSNVRIINKGLPTLLGIPCGAKKSNGYTVPEWIFMSPEYIMPFIRGLIETDGGVYIIHRGAATG